MKAVSFVPLLARLGIELGQFEEEERGGLILVDVNEDGINALTFLVSNDGECEANDAENQQLVDDRFLAVMKKLREMNLLKKEDIREYGILIYYRRVFRGKAIPVPSRFGPYCVSALTQRNVGLATSSFRFAISVHSDLSDGIQGGDVLFSEEERNQSPISQRLYWQ